MTISTTHSINYKLHTMYGIHNTHARARAHTHTHTHTPLCVIKFISCTVPHCCGICTLHQIQYTPVFNQQVIPGILLPCCKIDAVCQAHYHNAVKSTLCARHTTTMLWNWRSVPGTLPECCEIDALCQAHYHNAVKSTLCARHTNTMLWNWRSVPGTLT
jgi:hypothetical protein